MADIILNVQPEQLIAKAGQLNTERQNITGEMEEAKQLIASLTSYWESAASSEYQSRFNQIYDDIDYALRIVDSYINDLNQAADIYSKAEQNASTQAEGLPTTGVFSV